MKKIITTFQTISIIIGFVAIILIIIPIIIGIKPFIVLSGSMEPSIKTGGIAYINTHIKPEEIKVGDIIAFKIDNGQATHRVIKINEDKTFVTKGDNNANEDDVPVTYSTYKGKTVFVIPYIGKIISKFKTKIGVFLLTLFVGFNLLCVIFGKYIYEGSNETENNLKAKHLKQRRKNENE